MNELLPLSIGLGLVVSLLLAELFGIAAGGLIVPGYLALSLHQPLRIAATVGAGFVTHAIVQAMASFAIVYGRRRTVLTILTGYVIALSLRSIPGGVGGAWAAEYQLVGYIIPGLIALWLDRQGVVETLAALVTGAALVRLLLIVLLGPELTP